LKSSDQILPTKGWTNNTKHYGTDYSLSLNGSSTEVKQAKRGTKEGYWKKPFLLTDPFCAPLNGQIAHIHKKVKGGVKKVGGGKRKNAINRPRKKEEETSPQEKTNVGQLNAKGSGEISGHIKTNQQASRLRRTYNATYGNFTAAYKKKKTNLSKKTCFPRAPQLEKKTKQPNPHTKSRGSQMIFNQICKRSKIKGKRKRWETERVGSDQVTGV